jgi:uncharacterized protein YneF (UPF0154 family)
MDKDTIVWITLASAAVLIVVAILRLIAAAITHRTIRKAIETNPQLSDQLVRTLTARPVSSGDDRLAIVLVAIGVAMAVAPVIAIDDPGIVRFAVAAALFPLLVGGALWLRSRAVQRAQRRDPEQ